MFTKEEIKAIKDELGRASVSDIYEMVDTLTELAPVNRQEEINEFRLLANFELRRRVEKGQLLMATAV